MTTLCEDRILPFQLEGNAVRGRLVRLGPSIDTILHQHNYPPVVGNLLAEATAMAAALGTSLKFDGIFTLQARGEGPVSMIVADVTSDGAIRACAQYDEAALATAKPEESLLGHGTVVFTVDHNLSKERYQGVVALEGNSLTQAFQTYFRQSEQIPTGLMSVARRDEAGHWSAACLMMQRMPHEGGVDAPTDTSQEEDWHRAMMLMQTCTAEELTDAGLPSEQLLYRLFHQEGVRAYDPLDVRHECRCSRERIAALLAGMPKEDVDHMIVDGKATVTCQFCSKSYVFDQEALALLPKAQG